MSTVAEAPGSADPQKRRTSGFGGRARRLSIDVPIGLCLGAGLIAIAFVTSGGVDQTMASSGNTVTEIVLTLLGASALVGAILASGRTGRRVRGRSTLALMAALTVLTALSILWSVVPDTSWSAANQMLSYLAALAAGVALAALIPGRWRALLGAIAVAAAGLSAWALLAKVFPTTLAPNNTYGRLQAPFGYYNAVGMIGALGLPVLLWAGARRHRGRRLAGLAAPGFALAVAAVVLSSSRSADASAVVAVAVWLAFVPLRLRSVTVLALGGAGGAAISAWPLSHSVLTSDGTLTHAMDTAGHTFGVVLAVVLVIMTAAGFACAWAMDHRQTTAATRRRVGIALVVLAGLMPVAAVGAVAASSRGLTGQISHAWTTLTSTSGGATDVPGRVFEFGSSRPLYWHQGLDVGSHALLQGVGASGYGVARLRYTTNPAKSDQAHSYVIETFADLGLIGVAVMAALFVAWVLAALRPLVTRSPWASLPEPVRAERQGMAALGLVVLAFGIQSTLDWTWYFPGLTVPVLLCAGWLAGRGPLVVTGGVPAPPPPVRFSMLDRPGAVLASLLIAVIGLLGAWLEWQPQRSANQVFASVAASSNADAFGQARAAASSDPLSPEARFLLASLDQSVNDIAGARAELQHVVSSQPENPAGWAQLATLELQTHRPRQALTDLQRVTALDHTSDPMTRQAIAQAGQARAAIKATASPRS